MSGSNKFSNIKHRKGARDAQRSRQYSRLSRQIAVAVRDGGDDPADNAALRGVLRAARSVNMPDSSIQRAMQRAGGVDAAALQTVVYEAMVAGGVALVVEGLTDNHKRTTAFVRSTIGKHGGDLLRMGALAHLFVVRGRFVAGVPEALDAVVLDLVDEGLEDYEVEDGHLWLWSSREAFGRLQQALEQAGLEPTEATLVREPVAPRAVDAGAWASLQRVVEALEDSDDVRHVVHDARLRGT